MRNIYVRVATVMVATVAIVWVIPGVADAVELVFQVLVLIAST